MVRWTSFGNSSNFGSDFSSSGSSLGSPSFTGFMLLLIDSPFWASFSACLNSSGRYKPWMEKVRRKQWASATFLIIVSGLSFHVLYFGVLLLSYSENLTDASTGCEKSFLQTYVLAPNSFAFDGATSTSKTSPFCSTNSIVFIPSNMPDLWAIFSKPSRPVNICAGWLLNLM